MFSKRSNKRRAIPNLFDNDHYHNTYIHTPTNDNTQQISDKLTQRIEREFAIQNQTIYFRDLIIKIQDGYGEADWQPFSFNNKQPIETRLRAHIFSLLTFAQEDHRANYCEKISDESYAIKSGKENHITRLTTHEFSLYTKTPLSLDAYRELLADIENKAKKLEPNIHILLSSFAVILDEQSKTIMNVSIYIKSGKTPVIHSFSKNTSTKYDIDYEKTYNLFSQDNQITAEFIAFHSSNHSFLVNTSSVFEITTYGGAKCLQAFDICNDHVYGHAMQQLERQLLNKHAIFSSIPTQIEHCISSFSISIQKNKLIADKELHVDPNTVIKNTKKAALGCKSVNQDLIAKKISDEFHTVSVWETHTGYFIANPPFGRNYIIEVMQERPCAKPANKYLHAISIYNQDYITKRILNAMQKDDIAKNKAIQIYPSHSSNKNMINFNTQFTAKFFKTNQSHCINKINDATNNSVCNIF